MKSKGVFIEFYLSTVVEGEGGEGNTVQLASCKHTAVNIPDKDQIGTTSSCLSHQVAVTNMYMSSVYSKSHTIQILLKQIVFIIFYTNISIILY